MPVTLYVPRQYTKRQSLSSLEAPGRPVGQVAGSWVADRTALRQTVILCPFCVSKFNPRAHQYEPWRRFLYAVARCDDCRQISPRTRMFIHESLHAAVGEESPRRRRGRWRRSHG